METRIAIWHKQNATPSVVAGFAGAIPGVDCFVNLNLESWDQ